MSSSCFVKIIVQQYVNKYILVSNGRLFIFIFSGNGHNLLLNPSLNTVALNSVESTSEVNAAKQHDRFMCVAASPYCPPENSYRVVKVEPSITETEDNSIDGDTRRLYSMTDSDNLASSLCDEFSKHEEPMERPEGGVFCWQSSFIIVWWVQQTWGTDGKTRRWCA